MKQIALVTGANRGIGLEVCRQLAGLKDDYQVLLGTRSLEKGHEAVQKLGLSSSSILPIQLDVTNQESIDRVAKEIQDKYGLLDVLVNNAGINYDTHEQAISVDLEDVRRTMETNLYGPWRCSKTLLPLLRKSKNPRIVNVSSESGSITEMTEGGTPAYGVSKAALNALTRKLAAELPGIKVNAVCPGWVATDMGGKDGGPIEAGGASVLWACILDKDDDGPTGGFFRHGKPYNW